MKRILDFIDDKNSESNDNSSIDSSEDNLEHIQLAMVKRLEDLELISDQFRKSFM